MEAGSNYGALKVMEGAMKELFPGHRDKVVVLDVGAGTGLSGQIVSIYISLLTNVI